MKSNTWLLAVAFTLSELYKHVQLATTTNELRQLTDAIAIRANFT